jgi:hypothetical protein
MDAEVEEMPQRVDAGGGDIRVGREIVPPAIRIGR